ncbi:MAG: tannase/feruloyl esterase family alpha/beta hydrolase [Polaromonas sp.]
MTTAIDMGTGFVFWKVSRRGWRATVAGLAAGLLVAACGGGGGDSVPTAAQLAAGCAALSGKTFAAAAVGSAIRVEADAAKGTPGYCQVKANRAPFLDIEVDLPDNWSGRFYQQGGGGFDGSVPTVVHSTLGLHPALAKHGAVYAASNGGNRSNVPAEAAPGVWSTNAASATDYAYQAVGTTLKFGKAVTAAFYGKAPTYSYFSGCSNGGRNAYIAAQRWPTEYDGIVSGCETMDMAGQTAAWLRMAKITGTPAMPSTAQWSAAYRAAVAACDTLDGVADGVIANQAACTFDPASLTCGQPTASENQAICLTPEQTQTVKSVVSDIKLANGSTVYSRYSWADFGAGLGPTTQWVLGGGFAQLATNNKAWFVPSGTPGSLQTTFDVDRDYNVIGNGLQQIGADHDKAAVAAYVASGRKLISWHGSADEGLSINEHLRNYATMMGAAGTTANSRFFVVPGAKHGAGGQMQEVDWLAALSTWVEKGGAPVELTYNKLAPGSTTVVRSMPVCEHPKYPRYKGVGDVNAATSYTCVAP